MFNLVCPGHNHESKSSNASRPTRTPKRATASFAGLVKGKTGSRHGASRVLVCSDDLFHQDLGKLAWLPCFFRATWVADAQPGPSSNSTDVGSGLHGCGKSALVIHSDNQFITLGIPLVSHISTVIIRASFFILGTLCRIVLKGPPKNNMSL